MHRKLRRRKMPSILVSICSMESVRWRSRMWVRRWILARKTKTKSLIRKLCTSRATAVDTLCFLSDSLFSLFLDQNWTFAFSNIGLSGCFHSINIYFAIFLKGIAALEICCCRIEGWPEGNNTVITLHFEIFRIKLDWPVQKVGRNSACSLVGAVLTTCHSLRKIEFNNLFCC